MEASWGISGLLFNFQGIGRTESASKCVAACSERASTASDASGALGDESRRLYTLPLRILKAFLGKGMRIHFSFDFGIDLYTFWYEVGSILKFKIHEKSKPRRSKAHFFILGLISNDFWLSFRGQVVSKLAPKTLAKHVVNSTLIWSENIAKHRWKQS